MCGRYAVHSDPATLAVEFDAVDRTDGALGPDYNVTPTKTVSIIVSRGVERSVRPVRWGLVPTWAKDATSGPPMINARAETITTKPAYAESVARRRCLMPATGWYEWQPGDGRKQPYLCARRDGASVAMAAVFSAWWPPGADQPLVSCAVVTTDAVGEFADIHHRMPLVLSSARWGEWLDPDRADVAGLLAGPEDAAMEPLCARTVSAEVNNMRNNHPALLDEAPPIPEPAEQVALFES